MDRFESARKYIRKSLNAFVGLLTQPFEQDLNDALTAAATSVALAVTLPIPVLMVLPNRPLLAIGGYSFVLVLVWMVVTAVVTKAERVKLTLARNLSVVSFWIAVTLVFVMAAEVPFPDRYDLPPRLLIVLFGLLLAVPMHTFCNLRFCQAVRMTVILWLSTGGLVWSIMVLNRGG